MKHTSEQVTALIERLRNTPNWLRDGFVDWKDAVLTHDRSPFKAADMLEDYATHLRERESAKAAVTDEMIERAARAMCRKFDPPSSLDEMATCDKWRRFADEARCCLEAVVPMPASVRVPDGWEIIMQEKPVGATHYVVQTRWAHGKLRADVRWFRPWKSGGYAEWCTDCDNEYPDFRPLSVPYLSPVPVAAAPKPEEK